MPPEDEVIVSRTKRVDGKGPESTEEMEAESAGEFDKFKCKNEIQ